MEDRMLIQSVAEVYVSIMQVLNSFPGQCLRGQIYMQLSPKSWLEPLGDLGPIWPDQGSSPLPESGSEFQI